MSLRRRLLIYLLICAPVVWGLALVWSARSARQEVNEMFDTELVRLARQVQAVTATQESGAAVPQREAGPGGAADLDDLAIAIWDREGKPLLPEEDGPQLPRRGQTLGFEDLTLGGEAWRVYYMPSPDGERLIAVGQMVHERDELVWNFLGAQALPWLLVLPLLLGGLAWGVRAALSPLEALAHELKRRDADDLRTVSLEHAPSELQPMLAAMNGLFARIDDTLTRERQFTADAAHELRTPISVLTAQWAVYRGAPEGPERDRAARALDAGLSRMARLVEQLLGLSRLDATQRLKDTSPIDWPALVEQVMSDVLPLAERRRIELGCEWADGEEGAGPAWRGDPGLMGLLLRNLLDNAVRYAPEGSGVTLRFGRDIVAVENTAPADLDPTQMANWGERFHRPDGQAESGSGLGVSIARRIAELHRLALGHRIDTDTAGGVRVIAELSAR